MGGRITANLQNLPQYHVDYVEASEARRKQLADSGIRTGLWRRHLAERRL